MNLEKVSKEIVEGLGGVSNISHLTNCMTRVRATVKDNSLVNKEELEKIECVISVIEDSTVQVVVGPGKSRKIGDYINQNYQFNNKENVSSDKDRDYIAENKEKRKQNDNKFKQALKK